MIKIHDKIWYVETPNKPKVVQVVRNEKLTLDIADYQWYVPKRVKIKSGLEGSWSYVSGELIGVEFKE